MQRPATATLAVLLLTACSAGLFSPGEYRELARAKAQWDARGFADYAYETRVGCFCPVELGRWSRVEVRGGEVRRVVDVETGDPWPEHLWTMWRTVEELFTWIGQAVQAPDLTDVRVRFDPALGFPVEATFSYDPRIADAGSASYLRNVAPLP